MTTDQSEGNEITLSAISEPIQVSAIPSSRMTFFLTEDLLYELPVEITRQSEGYALAIRTLDVFPSGFRIRGALSIDEMVDRRRDRFSRMRLVANSLYPEIVITVTDNHGGEYRSQMDYVSVGVNAFSFGYILGCGRTSSAEMLTINVDGIDWVQKDGSVKSVSLLEPWQFAIMLRHGIEES